MSLTEGVVGLDHVILVVPDLKQAMGELAFTVGLVVQPGGEHPGWGTHNAIVRFGVTYLELIAVSDLALAQQRPRGTRLLEALQRGPGWLGFALGCSDIAATVAALRARGVSIGDPEPGRRTRPDGVELRWQTATVGDAMWGADLPFLIQHATPAATRASWAPPQGHPSGATGIAALDIAVEDMAAAEPTYRLLTGSDDLRLPDGTRIRLVETTAHHGLFSVSLRVPRPREALTVLGAHVQFASV